MRTYLPDDAEQDSGRFSRAIAALAAGFLARSGIGQVLLAAGLVAGACLLAMRVSFAITVDSLPGPSTESEPAEVDSWILNWCHGKNSG